MNTGLTLFDTAIGRCGIVWGEHGLLGVQLPEASDAATKTRLRAKTIDAPDADPPPQVVRAIEAMTDLLDGDAADLSLSPSTWPPCRISIAASTTSRARLSPAKH